MEAEEMINNSRVHHGRNIRRTRIEKEIKQDALSDAVHMSQPTVSRYESMRVIDDEILERFARALKVPVEYLKTLEEDAPSLVFESNSVTNNGNNSNTNNGINENTNQFNPIDKITELYERIIKDKDEKYAALERRIQSLEKGNNE